MNQDWNRHVGSTDPVHNIHDTHVPDGIVLSASESETESEPPPLIPRRQRKLKSTGSRRQPTRKSKTGFNYKCMFVLFAEQADISKESTSSIVGSDCAYLSSLDLHRKDFK